jgi:hypothetical protein
MKKIVIDTDYMDGLYNYYIKDLTIQKYSDYIKDHVFNHGWNVLFNNEYIIELFGYPHIKSYLQNILYECRIYLRLYGFFVYYVTKDIDEWLKWYKSQLKEFGEIFKQTEIEYYPFGILTPSQVEIYRLVKKKNPHSRLLVKPIEKVLNSRYDIRIFNESMKEEKLDSIIDNMNNSVKIITPFLRLYNLYKNLEESKENRYDADWNLSHPETFVVPEPLQNVPLDHINTNTLYTSMDLIKTTTDETIKTSRMFLEEAQSRIEALKQHISPYYKVEVRTAKKNFYKRVDLREGLVTIPNESAKLYKTHDPSTIIDIDKEQFNYEKAISGVFGLDYRLFDSTSYKSRQNVSEDTSTAMQSFQTLIQMEQKKINDIFSILYESTFGLIENKIKEELLKIDDDMLNIENNNSKDIKSNDKQKKTDIKTNDKDKTKIKKNDANEVLKKKNDRIRASIVFDKKSIPTDTEVKILETFFDKGFVDYDYVKQKINEWT